MTGSNRMRARAKAHMPMVILTLVSVLQALALELLWAHVRETPSLMIPDWTAVLEWTQLAATLLGVLLIWILYSNMVMRFRWVPSTGDSMFPFAIGLLEFTMIGALGSSTLGQWFVVLGMVFGVTTAALQIVMRRARLDGENNTFFASVPRATARSFVPTALLVLGLVVTGGILYSTEYRGPLALLAILAAMTALLYQMLMSHRYWRRALELDEPSRQDAL